MQKPKTERNRKIYEEYEKYGKLKTSKVSFRTLGEKYGLSPASIKEIYHRERLKRFEERANIDETKV